MDELQDRGRQLVARYAEQGLGGMSTAEVRLLLSAKQLHLGRLSERCQQGQSLHVNVPLKRALEGQVGEIGQYADYLDRLAGKGAAAREPEKEQER